MCPEALIEHVENMTKIFRSEQFPDFYIRSAYASDNEQLIQLSSQQIDCGVFRLNMCAYPSYLVVSQLQYNRSETKVIVLEKQPEVIVGMLNIGWKYCYINEQPDLIRYISDLNINCNYRDRQLIRFFIQFMHETIPKRTVIQSIVPQQHPILQSVFYKAGTHAAHTEVHDDVHIYNLTNMPEPEQYTSFRFECLASHNIVDANQYLESMKKFYNFLPNYDLRALMNHEQPFWCGLKLNDFFVVYNKLNQIIGFYGLWDQTAFKKTSIADYHYPYKILRLLYNCISHFNSGQYFPKPGKVMNYANLHSALCHPDHQDVFASLLYHATLQAKQRRLTSFSFALSEHDPRCKALVGLKYYRMKAKHALHCFGEPKTFELDGNKINYFELGRL